MDHYDYSTSLSKSLKIIDLAASRNDAYYLNHGYNLLGITYEILEDSVRSRENYQKALEYARISKNDTLLWYAYNNLGNIYSSNESTVGKGLDYYKKAIDIATGLPDSEQVLIPMINIGWTYLENEKYDAAYPYLTRSAAILTDKADPKSEASIEALFGMYYTGKGNEAKAVEHFEKAVTCSERDSLIVEAAFAYGEYAKMLSGAGRYKEAFNALEAHKDYRERIFQIERNQDREIAYGRFETNEVKKSLALARREEQYKDQVIQKSKQITLIMIISLVVLVAILLLLFRSNKIRNTLIGKLREKNDELIASKDQAEKLSMMKTRFFSTVSHELRTPLYGVVGLASLLLDENKDKEQEEDLKSLKFSADYLLALINDVLQVNKMDSDLVHLENSDFNIRQLFTGIVKSFETSHKNNNTLELQIDNEIPNVLVGDAMRLSQVVMNLVGNAIKFTHGGVVWLKAEKKACSGDHCRIYFEIGDTGIGIPEDKQGEIFEEFSQLKAQSMDYQGTGLGLPIVKKLLQLFDSEIHLDSREGQGSVFSFEIRFARGVETEILQDQPAEIPVEGTGTRKLVMIVDDNRINRIVTKRILEKRNFECITASSGEKAISLLQSLHVDLVLMDVHMPGMNGMETTAEIRKFNTAVPIIALTAVEVGEMREEILSTGMNDIINKPYDIPQFINTIFRNLLQQVA